MEIKIDKIKLEEGKLTEISANPKIIGYFNGKRYFALSGICPHAKWPLELGSVDDCILTCAGHSWGFNITDGECKTNPGRDLTSYNISETENEIIISDK
jgi:nitrite reductase/ring-hydroxylating ferredoxin subunit